MIVSPIERDNNRVKLLDQTKLPEETNYLVIDDYPALIGAIQRLSIRGAPAIGIAGAYGLALAVNHSGDYSEQFIRRVAREIATCRPTAVNLSWAINRLMTRYDQEKPQTLDDTLNLFWSEAELIHAEDRKMCQQIGEHSSSLIKADDSILTHCNAGALATGGIGTALAGIYVAHQQGKKVHVYADETRPLLQGARLTAWEMSQAGINCTLVVDSVAAMLMSQGKVDLVIVGADRIAANGDTANKIGTYSVAVNAEKHGVPFYVAAPYSTIDSSLPTGKDIPVEERASEEVTEGFGRRTAPSGIAVYSPAFDITPVDLITGFITDKGIRPGGRA